MFMIVNGMDMVKTWVKPFSWSPTFIMAKHVHFIGSHGQNMVIVDMAMVINAGEVSARKE